MHSRSRYFHASLPVFAAVTLFTTACGSPKPEKIALQVDDRAVIRCDEKPTQ